MYLNTATVFVLIVVSLANRQSRFKHWNVTDWWKNNRDFDHKVSRLAFEAKPLDLNMIMKNGKLPVNTGNEIVPGGKVGIPTSSASSIKKTILENFSKTRSYRSDNNNFNKLKEKLKKYFIDLGLKTAEQEFWPPEIGEQRGRNASNLVAIWPGKNRGKPGDEIIVIGAHYDTVRSAPGVDDNGSGSASVMEIAKLVSKNVCQFNRTLMFVLFDMEEDGLKGSKHFVKDYLIPIEINKNNATVVGAYIMDMILAYDPTPGSQSTSDFDDVVPNWVKWVKKNDKKADFAAIWARQKFDTKLFEVLDKNWLNKDKYKLALMAGPLPQFGSELENDPEMVYIYHDLARSDHASFWYPTQHNITFPAILIHDLAPWRKKTMDEYHNEYDNAKHLSEQNLAFAKNTVDSVIRTIFELAEGKCYA